MEKSIVGIDTPVSIKGLTIIPVWKISLNYSFAAGVWISSTKKPIAAVIVSPMMKKTLKITGEEVPLEQLLQEVPGLEEALAKAQK